MNWCRIVLLVLLLFHLSACDPSHRLIVDNQSGKLKHLTVLGICRESMAGSATSIEAPYLKNIPLDSPACVNKTFSFQLQPGYKAVIEHGLGPIPYTKLIVVDKKDTVKVQKSKGRISKKPRFWMGGDYTLTIN